MDAVYFSKEATLLFCLAALHTDSFDDTIHYKAKSSMLLHLKTRNVLTDWSKEESVEKLLVCVLHKEIEQ